MRESRIIKKIEEKQLKKKVPQFEIGDSVRVSTKIIEGSKERIQTITGTVIARKGSGLSATFTIYRIAYGSAMERVFPLHSPRVTGIECVKKGRVRRSKLYYLRGLYGKKAKIREDLRTLVKEEGSPQGAPPSLEPPSETSPS